MDCECAECTEYGGPDPATMRLRFFFIFTQLFVGLVGMIKARNWKALAAFLSGFTLFWTVPRYLICARCEGYGQNCRSLYLGKITSMYMPKQEGEVGPLGMALELVALSLVSEAPLIGMRKNKKLLVLYMLLLQGTLWLHFSHSCRHCAYYATDWRHDCPSARMARAVFTE